MKNALGTYFINLDICEQHSERSAAPKWPNRITFLQIALLLTSIVFQLEVLIRDPARIRETSY